MKKAILARIIVALAVVMIAVPSFADAGATNTNPPVNTGGANNAGGSMTLSACKKLDENGFGGVVTCIGGIFNTLVYLLMAASVIYIMLGAFNMIRSEEKREEGKQTIYYGVVGLFVMISIWGLVNILVSTFDFTKKNMTDVTGDMQFINLNIK